MLSQDERLNLIMKFEGEDITESDFLLLFSDLIKSGLCWKLQGTYGRTARDLIDENVITGEGEIL